MTTAAIKMKQKATRELFDSAGKLKEEITSIGEFYKRLRDIYEPVIAMPVPLNDAPLHVIGLLYAPKLDYPVKGQVHDGGPEGRFGSSGEAHGMDFTHWCEIPKIQREGE